MTTITNYTYTPLKFDDLLPHLHNPEVTAGFRVVYELLLDVSIGGYLSPRQAFLKNDGSWRVWFRFDKNLFSQILSDNAPWELFPCCVVTPLENIDEFRHYIGTPQEDRYQRAKEDMIELDTLYLHAKEGGMNSAAWWAIPHMCDDINGRILLPWLRVSYPHITFQFVRATHHSWVHSPTLNQNFDLYHPAIGILEVPEWCRDDVHVYDDYT